MVNNVQMTKAGISIYIFIRDFAALDKIRIIHVSYKQNRYRNGNTLNI